jgi:phosphoribosylformylglycinamidine synthase
MWSFSEVIDGMAEACRAFNTPVVSGNVSFYNETEGRGILPTPVIGMIGLVEDVRRVVQPGFKNEGDVIALLGEFGDDLLLSEHAATVGGATTDEMLAGNAVPALDLQLEVAVQATCLAAAEAGLLASAHDCADGGFAVAVAESCFSTLNRKAIGAKITLPESLKDSISEIALLFGETPSRIIISFPETSREAISEIARREKCPLMILGEVGGTQLNLKIGTTAAISANLNELEETWRASLARKLEAEVMAAGME